MAALASQLRRGAMPWLLLTSFVAFVAIALIPHGAGSSVLGQGGQAATFLDTLALMPSFESIPRLALDWWLMVVAMMVPLVSVPISYLRNASHDRVKWAVTTAFLVSYVGMWMLAGVFLAPLTLLVTSVPAGIVIGVGAIVLAMLWSASPWAQLGRNRCHRTVRVGGLPPTVCLDGARQGFQTGSGCIVTCWPWMLAPMVIDGLHLPAMVAITLYLFLDRMAPPSTPAWRWPPAFAPCRPLLSGFSTP